jgi:hypothetical protein
VNGHKISSIILMNVIGALVKPKGMTNHSKRPSLDLKVVFHTSVDSIRNLVIARLQINLTKELGTLELIKKIINLGDQVSVLDNDFIQGSIINTESPCVPSFFCTNTIGLPQGEELGQMWPFWMSS